MKLEMGEDCHHRLTQEMHFGKIKTASHKLKAFRGLGRIYFLPLFMKNAATFLTSLQHMGNKHYNSILLPFQHTTS